MRGQQVGATAMVEQSLFRQPGVKPIRPLPGKHTKAMLLLVNGEETGYYAAKHYLDEYPYMMVAEFVCANLASRLGLPIPARRSIIYKSHVWLGFEWHAPDPKPLVPSTFGKLVNPEAIPSVLAFDVFVCNWDRKDENLLVQKVDPKMEMYELFMIDHSAAMGGDCSGDIVHWLNSDKDTKSYLERPSHLLGCIESLQDFEPFLARLEALRPQDNADIVDAVPHEWRPRHQDKTDRLSGFLIRRKRDVRTLLGDVAHDFGWG
jgi:hypothetical protein